MLETKAVGGGTHDVYWNGEKTHHQLIHVSGGGSRGAARAGVGGYRYFIHNTKTKKSTSFPFSLANAKRELRRRYKLNDPHAVNENLSRAEGSKIQESADLLEMKTVTNRRRAQVLTIKIGGKNGTEHSYKKYGWGLHHPLYGPLKDKMFNSKSEMKAAMETHPAYNPQLKEEASVRDKASGLPKKYVAGLSPSTAKARAAHFARANKLSDRDPRAYEPAPGDATAKTKPSKHTLAVRKMMKEGSADSSLEAKAKKSGISVSTLKAVYRRGVAAWNSGHRPGTTPQQWGHARVNSYIRKGSGTYHGADKDLREETKWVEEVDTTKKNRVKAIKAGVKLNIDPDTRTPDHFTAAMRRKRGLPEDVPANNAGGGNIAGIGVGSQGEPPGKLAIMKKTPLKRFKDFLKKTMK